MGKIPLSDGLDEKFNFPCQANQDTTWATDPANPLVSQTGPIRKGDTIWLQTERFGSGPSWQVARLADHRVCFVQPHHFDSLNS
jgi:hypothetical protein